MALVARPALLWVRGLRISEPDLLWEVPSGPACAAIAVAITVCTAALAVRVCVTRTRGTATHAALLLAVTAAIAFRGTARQARASRIARADTREKVRADTIVPPYRDASRSPR
jgi:hypothetical protein